MGDAGVEVEEDLIQKYNLQDIDVLKVGHHGSTYSSGNQFLKAVDPDIAVITTSKDTETGHPHIQALNRLKNINATIYQSAVHGTITVSSNGESIYIVTEKN